jgi:hypothetical protein
MGKRARQRDDLAAQAAAATIAGAPRRGGVERPAAPTGVPPQGPQPLWGPVPVTEVALIVGGIVLVLGTLLGEDGAFIIGAGLLMITLSSLELCIREHFSGYRPHVLFLAMMPTIVLQTVVLIVVGRRLDPALQIAGDLIVFVALVFVMRATFKRARPRWLARRKAIAS